MNCLNDKTLREYAAGRLDADETASVYAHICACKKCREKYNDLVECKRAIWSIGCNLLDTYDCPEYEELSDFVSETLAKEAADRVRTHIAQCKYCHRDVASIQEIRSRASLAGEIEVYPDKFALKKEKRLAALWRQALAGAAAAAVIAAAITLTQTTAKLPSVTPQTAAKPSTNIIATKPDKQTPNVSAGKLHKKPVHIASSQTGKDKIVKIHSNRDDSISVALKDADVIVKEHSGKYIININEQTLAELVDRKLKNGSLPAVFTLAKNPTSLRGAANSIEIPKITPKSYGTAESKPEFRWEPVDGAIRYRIEVFKLDGTPVIAAETEDTFFMPEENLPAGGYKWIVGIRRAELADIRWSKADAFRVLSAKEKSLIELAEQKHPESKLVLGCVYEYLGLNEEAAQQFEQLVKENPDSELAKKLLAGVTKKLH